MIKIDEKLIQDLFAKAEASERKRMNYDLRTSSNDGSQRMLNALLPGTVVPIHRHPMSNENVILLSGKLVEVLYDTEGNETARIHLDPSVGNFGCVVPAGAWHTVEVLEPSVIYEAKDGKYGEDGSETFGTKTITKTKTEESVPGSCVGDLKEQITYLIGMERHSGSMEVITPLYVSRMLNVSLEDVEKCMKEMEVQVGNLWYDDDDDNDNHFVAETIMMAPAAGFYTTPGSGVNQVRLAYVLCKEDIQRALFLLENAIEKYNAR